MNKTVRKFVILALFTCMSSQTCVMQNITYKTSAYFDIVHILAYNNNSNRTTVLWHQVSTNEFDAYSVVGKKDLFEASQPDLTLRAINPNTFISCLQKLSMEEKKREEKLEGKAPNARPIKKALQDLKNTAIIEGKLDNEKMKSAEDALIQLDSERARKKTHFRI